MIQAVRSEFRKLLTIRSTYVIIAICLAIIFLFAFFIEGYHLNANVTSSGKLASEVISAASTLGLFIALIGVLLVTHEYRYNTIIYTLTASASRTKVFLAKVFVVSVFAVLLTLFFCFLAPLLTYAGIHAKGLSMVPQTLHVLDLLWRSVFYGWCYSMFALLIAFIVRNQVGTIAVLFLYPGPGEALLTLLLKSNAKYLPFRALAGVIQNIPQGLEGVLPDTLNPPRAALFLTGYLAVLSVAAWVLFRRRDAS